MKKIIILIGIILAVIIVLGAVVTLVFSNTEIAYKPNTNENRVVQPVKFGHANVYFIKTKNGHILVDAGMPGDSTKLDNVFSIAGIDPQSIRLIIVTHGHLDHTGLLAYAKAATGAEVLSHESLSKKLADGEGEAAIPQNSFGHFLNFNDRASEYFGRRRH